MSAPTISDAVHRIGMIDVLAPKLGERAAEVRALLAAERRRLCAYIATTGNIVILRGGE